MNVGGGLILCQGHEYYCCDLSCNCEMVNIIIHEAAKTNRSMSGFVDKRLTHILYGWRSYKHYVKEQFLERDCKGIVAGSLNLSEPKNHLNEAILASLHFWLKRDKKRKDQLFAQRYKKFREKLLETDMGMTENTRLSESEMQKIFESLSDTDLLELARKMKF